MKREVVEALEVRRAEPETWHVEYLEKGTNWIQTISVDVVKGTDTQDANWKAYLQVKGLGEFRNAYHIG
jgi:hypothetical protein